MCNPGELSLRRRVNRICRMDSNDGDEEPGRRGGNTVVVMLGGPLEGKTCVHRALLHGGRPFQPNEGVYQDAQCLTVNTARLVLIDPASRYGRFDSSLKNRLRGIFGSHVAVERRGKRHRERFWSRVACHQIQGIAGILGIPICRACMFGKQSWLDIRGARGPRDVANEFVFL